MLFFFGTIVKNQYQEQFFDNSGNGFEKSDPENPYIGQKSTQNFSHIEH